MTTALLSVTNLSVTYAGVAAVAPLSFAVESGERLAILGANGAGKSSLLRGLMALAPTTGEIVFAGANITALTTAARARLGIAFAPEGRRVFAGMSVRENLEVAAHAAPEERRRRLDSAYTLFPQLAERDSDAAWQLSGGQQQMLAIARAMMARPKLLLMDEPSLGLAPTVAADVVAALAAITAADTTIVLAEQNAGLALDIAMRALILERGRLVFEGAADEIRARPELLSPAAAADPVKR